MDKKEIDSERLNGVTIDEALKEEVNAYKLSYDKVDSTAVLKDPNSERARRISSNVQNLENVVKSTLSSDIRASRSQAQEIISKLAYQLARTEGYTGKPEELPDERKATYLANAASALGNPVIGNVSEFVQNLMDLSSAKPGDPLYDTNSALAQLINYISTRQDKEQVRLSYLDQQIAAAWQHPDKGFKLQKAFREAFGLDLGPHASAAEAQREVRNYGTRQTQEFIAKQPKTYHAPQASK